MNSSQKIHINIPVEVLPVMIMLMLRCVYSVYICMNLLDNVHSGSFAASYKEGIPYSNVSLNNFSLRTPKHEYQKENSRYFFPYIIRRRQYSEIFLEPTLVEFCDTADTYKTRPLKCLHSDENNWEIVSIVMKALNLCKFDAFITAWTISQLFHPLFTLLSVVLYRFFCSVLRHCRYALLQNLAAV